jgi:hypothetical protein
MSFYDSAVKNWKSTVSQLLTIVLVVTSIMAAQQITLGHFGAGTVVAFVSAVAKGVMAVISQDPKVVPSVPQG